MVLGHPNDNHLKIDWKFLVIHVIANTTIFFKEGKDINHLAICFQNNSLLFYYY